MNNKIIITGHTSGIGKELYDTLRCMSYKEIIGMSRTNGYHLEDDFEKIVEEATGCDIFINNAYCGRQQFKLVEALKDKVDMMVVMGSAVRHYPELLPTEYTYNKQELAEACRLISIDPNGIPLLHLDLSFIEGSVVDPNDPTVFVSDYNVSCTDIAETIIFWTQKPTIRQIEFRWKLTPYVYSELKRVNPNLDPSRITF